MRLGSEQHKNVFCDVFVETHEPYEAADVVWPDLDERSLRTLRALPIWNEAVNTEIETAAKVKSIADAERDERVSAALDVQAYEERRHSELLAHLTAHYGIDVQPRPAHLRRRPEWNFLTVGYAECMDSFLAFGIYDLAARSGLFHPKLLEVFDLVMQEEARHILFFENWRIWRRRGTTRGPGLSLTSAAVASQLLARVVLAGREALGAKRGEHVDDNFLMDFGVFADGLDARSFVGVCLDEHERRLAPYDSRLARPGFAPALARAARRVLPSRTPTSG